MPENQTPDRQSMLFANLVMMLSSTAMQQMGKLVDPQSGTCEAHLESAQALIDMLDVLKARTAGNLAKEEQHLLDDVLSSLKMTYVETAAAAAGASGTPSATAPEATADTAPDAPEGGAPAADAHEPRYHKTYGDAG